MAKESKYVVGNSPIFRETFNDQQTVEGNGGVVTDVSFSEGIGSFNGVSSRIHYTKKNINLSGSIRIIFDNLDNFDTRYLLSGTEYSIYGDAVNTINAEYYDGAYKYVNGPVATGGGEVVVTHDGSSLIMYFNGVLVDTEACGSLVSQGANILSIGNYTTLGFYSKNDFDLVEIYDYTLTSEEVSNLYNNSRYLEFSGAPVLNVTSESGVIEDKAGNSFTNTDVEVVRDGQIWVSRYNGTSSTIKFSEKPDYSTSLTAFFWLKKEDASLGWIIGDNNNNGATLGIQIDYGVISNILKLMIQSISVDINTVTYPIFKEWHCFTFVYSGGNYMRAYLDGELVSENTVSIPASISTSSNLLTVGSGAYYSGGYLKGNLGGIRLYDVVLSSEDVSRLYTSTKFKYTG